MTLVNRWYEILQLLYFNQRLSIDELKEKLKLSPQTIKSSIDTLNQELMPIAQISFNDKMYCLMIYQYEEFQEILHGRLKKESDYNSSSRRLAYIVKRLIEDGSYLYIDDLAEEIGVSRGTLSKDIKQSKELLADYQLVIRGTPNKGIILTGEELSQRLFYMQQIVPYFPIPALKPTVQAGVQKIIDDYQLDYLSENLLKLAIHTAMMRLRQRKQIDVGAPPFIQSVQLSPELEELLFEVEESYQLTLSQTEQEFILFPIIISHQKTIKIVDYDYLQSIFMQMINKTRKTIYWDVDETALFVEIKNHLLNLLLRLYYHIELNDLFSEQIEKKYPFAYELAKVSITEVAQILRRPYRSVEVNYLTFYYELFLQKDHSKKVKSIAIVCNTGKGTAGMIRAQIEQIIGSDIAITQYSEKEYTNIDLNDYFAVFTTIPLKNIDVSTPVIRITQLFNDEWLRNAWQQATKLRSRSYHYVDIHYHLIDSTSTYEQILASLVQPYVLQGVLDADFYAHLLERENKSSTIYEQKIAFPHTLNTSSQRVQLIVGIPKTAIQTQQGSVTLITLLAIPKDLTKLAEDELMKVYGKIFELVGDKEKMAQIEAIQDEDSMWQFIDGKELF